MIPPCTEFTPFGAPPGVAVDFAAFRGADGQDWYRSRPQIKARLALVHTNGATKEGTLQSQINWGNAAPSNTKPHYAVNRPQPTKLVPSDRQGIGNYKVAAWSLVIETADAGWPVPGNLGGFLADHAEIVARILAYESIVADHIGSSMPLEYPKTWNGAGVGAHTEPFGYPYWTNSQGKACPGDTKKSQLLQLVLPRARVLRDGWLDPQPPEDDMELFTLKELPAPLYQRIGNVVRWISPDVWAVMGRPAPGRVMPASEAKTYFISGPSPDGSGAFLAQVA